MATSRHHIAISKNLLPLVITYLNVVLLVVAQSSSNTQIIVEYDLLEEQPNITYIGNLITDSGLSLRIQNANNTHRDIKFSILQQSAQWKPYFSIEDGTGLFTTNVQLDRDKICEFIDICILELEISAIGKNSYIEVFKVKVNLIDINDNVPHFPQDTETVQMSELTTIGTAFSLNGATDKDASPYNIQRYLLDANVNNFELEATHGGSGLSDPKLVLKHTLDREQQHFYTVKVLAIDGGIPSQTGTMTVQITVTDANDNDPKFDNNTYTTTIEENTQIGSTVILIHAQDNDTSNNGQIVYTFSQASQSAFGHLFALNPSSGAITVQGTIDFDQASSLAQYTLGVVASDGGDNPRSDRATVIIYVDDVNDNAPHIVLNTDAADSASNTTVTVSEHAPRNSFVTHISVIDPDRGSSGQVECLLNHAFFQLVQLPYDKQYKLVTSAALDRETDQLYRVTIICHDKGDPALSASESIRIIVEDENDHAPVFLQPVYPVALHENNQLNVQLTQMRATDGDTGDNARITYSIYPPYDELLLVDENNGFIRTRSILDYEISHHYDIVVSATDHGDPAMSSNATISLSILDSNDEPPRFNQTHYTFGTLENQHAGTEVGIVEATDIDSSSFNHIVYTIDIQSPDAGVFKIPDPKVGKITLRKVLDREQQDRYSILVIASNPGYSLHTVANVTIFVGDENDNSPQMYFPNIENNKAQISSFAEKGDLVTQIIANDTDVGRNSYLYYKILAGNIHSIFMINPASGEIFVNKSLEPYKDRDIRLSVLVKDRGEPSLSVVSDLEVFINSSALVSSSPVSRSTTNLQLIIILVLSVLAISLFLAVLIVLVAMRRKHKQKQQSNNRYKLDITFAPVTAAGNSAVVNTEVDSITGSPIAERKQEGDGEERTNGRGYDGLVKPPPYTEKNLPKVTYVSQEGSKPDSRKVHFAETDSAYDSIDKEEEEMQNQANMQHLQLQQLQQPLGGNRPVFTEQQRHRLLYRLPNAKATDNQHLQINNQNADVESDQGSSIDSGRGPSEDEHNRLNTSVSLMPNPHLNPSFRNTKIPPVVVANYPQQHSYPDLVKCTCGVGGNMKSYPHYNNDSSHSKHHMGHVHRKGCPQRLSPKTADNKDIGSLQDFQNLLGLPPKTYNKKKQHKNASSKNHNKSKRIQSDSSVSSPVISDHSHLDSSFTSSAPSIPHHPSNKHRPQLSPRSPDSATVNPLAAQYTQQCYNDIAQQKKAKYGGSSGGGHGSSNHSSHPTTHSRHTPSNHSSSSRRRPPYGDNPRTLRRRVCGQWRQYDHIRELHRGQRD